MTRTLVVAVVLALAGAADAADLADARIFQSRVTRPLATLLASTVARTLPLTAASPGVTFTFDKESHAFERHVDLLGQLYLERPRPLGRGRWNVALSYEWVRLDTLDGRDVDALTDPLPIKDPDRRFGVFFVRRVGLDVVSHVVTTSVTYGLTDDADVNLTVPVVSTDFAARLVAHVPSPRFTVAPVSSGHATGFGDVFLRAKYRVLRERFGELAAGLVLRLPTGDERNFQGTGSFEPAPMLYAATPSLHLGGVRVDGYANGGVELNSDDVARSAARWGVGVDVAPAPRWTAAVAVLGREEFAGFAPPGFADVPHAVQTQRRPPRFGPPFPAPFLGLQRDPVRAYDLSLGGRIDLWRDTVFGFADVLLPLNRDGLRADVIPLVGIEAAF